MHLDDNGHNALDVITKVLLIPYGTHLENSLYILGIERPKNKRKCIRNHENRFLFGFMFWRDRFTPNTRLSQFSKNICLKRVKMRNMKVIETRWWPKICRYFNRFLLLFCRRVSSHLSSFIRILKPLSMSFIAENRAGNFVWLPSCGINYQIILFFFCIWPTTEQLVVNTSGNNQSANNMVFIYH